MNKGVMVAKIHTVEYEIWSFERATNVVERLRIERYRPLWWCAVMYLEEGFVLQANVLYVSIGSFCFLYCLFK